MHAAAGRRAHPIRHPVPVAHDLPVAGEAHTVRIVEVDRVLDQVRKAGTDVIRGSIQDVAIESRRSLRHQPGREVRLDQAPPVLTETAAQLSIVEQAVDRGEEGLRIPRRHEEAGLTVAHHFRHAAATPPDHGLSPAHRLQVDETEGFVERGRDEECAVVVQPLDIAVRQDAMEAAAAPPRCAAMRRLEALPEPHSAVDRHGVVSDDVHVQIGMALEQPRQQGEQRIDPLSSLETADEQQPPLRGWGSDRARREAERDCPVAATDGIDAHRFPDGVYDGAGRGGDAVSVPDAPALEIARQTEVHCPRPSLGRRDDRQRRDDAKDDRDEPGPL